ncbi:MAG: hypothetical protein ACYSWQ_06575 [Planctomycetota bacterium]|jgi:hypothetical protein
MRWALEIPEKSLGLDHPSTQTARENLEGLKIDCEVVTTRSRQEWAAHTWPDFSIAVRLRRPFSRNDGG